MPKSITGSEIMIVSLISGDVMIKGVSGRDYHFPHVGSEVKVLATDAEVLLKKKRQICCGGGWRPFFKLGG